MAYNLNYFLLKLKDFWGHTQSCTI